MMFERDIGHDHGADLLNTPHTPSAEPPVRVQSKCQSFHSLLLLLNVVSAYSKDLITDYGMCVL